MVACRVGRCVNLVLVLVLVRVCGALCCVCEVVCCFLVCVWGSLFLSVVLRRPSRSTWWVSAAVSSLLVSE